MHSFQYHPRSIALFMALSAVALSAAVPAAFAADEAAAPDRTHAAAGATAKQDDGAKSNMMQIMEGMQAMHTKMMTARSPTERGALMKDQMAMMQSGMNMMKSMQGASAMRMDVMQMMMQMMIDRMAAPATEASKPGAPK